MCSSFRGKSVFGGKAIECAISRANEAHWTAFWHAALHYMIDLNIMLTIRAEAQAAAAEARARREARARAADEEARAAQELARSAMSATSSSLAPARSERVRRHRGATFIHMSFVKRQALLYVLVCTCLCRSFIYSFTVRFS